MLNRRDLIQMQLNIALAEAINKTLRELLAKAKKEAGICAEDDCMEKAENEGYCDWHSITREIDSHDETMSKFFVDDSKQL